MSINEEKNPFAVGIEIENTGFSELKLNQVLVNGNQQPKKVKLGISRSNTRISIYEVDYPPKGVSFHNIGDYPIITPPKSKYKYLQFDTIRNYGIIVYNDSKIQNINIKYSYLGIPFEEIIEVKFN